MPTVLIADDSPFMRLLIRETLSVDPTLSFLEAADGVAALEAAQTARPDLIILDINMPQMDGLQVCRLVKADPLLRAVPIILVTAYDLSENERAGREVGAERFVKKPFNEAELRAMVTELLQNRA